MASIFTLCRLTQSPSMAAAAATTKHGEWGFLLREGGRQKPWGKTRCSTGAGPGAAPRVLNSPRPALLCPANMAPFSAWCSDLGCAHSQRGWAGREQLHTKQTSRPLGSTEHPALQQKGWGQQHSKAARPMSDHHRLCSSFLLCGWHGGCIWNRYGAAAIGLHTRVNVFVNSAQVRGESLSGQSYRQLVTLHFSPRAPAKFGFFSIMPLNVKPKSKQ